MAQMLRGEWARRPELAADAHDCIMVRSAWDSTDTVVWRDVPRPMASSPRIITQTFNGRRQTPELRRKPISLFIVPPRAQASRRCETQATLRRQAAKLCCVSVP